MSEFRGTIELGALCLKCSERIFTAADIKFVMGSKDAELAILRTRAEEAELNAAAAEEMARQAVQQGVSYMTRAEAAEARVAELELENVHLAGQAMCEGERANEAEAERDAMRGVVEAARRAGSDPTICGQPLMGVKIEQTTRVTCPTLYYSDGSKKVLLPKHLGGLVSFPQPPKEAP